MLMKGCAGAVETQRETSGGWNRCHVIGGLSVTFCFFVFFLLIMDALPTHVESTIWKHAENVYYSISEWRSHVCICMCVHSMCTCARQQGKNEKTKAPHMTADGIIGTYRTRWDNERAIAVSVSAPRLSYARMYTHITREGLKGILPHPYHPHGCTVSMNLHLEAG